MTKKQHKNSKKLGAIFIALCCITLFIPNIIAQVTTDNNVKPSIPSANRHQRNKVFLEYADKLSMKDGQNYQLLVGNVQFRKGDMFMYCDSAHFYDQSNSLDAYGNVKMEQGDTLFVYADELNYDGEIELAKLYADEGKKVKLINKDVMLETDIFNYDLAIDLGYYDVGGVLTDKENRLESQQGEYSPTTKDANFYLDVHLNNSSERDTLDMYTDTLSYNTNTHIAELVSLTHIFSKDGKIIAQSGTYNTETNISDLYERSTIITNDGNTLTGDTIFYDRNKGYGEAFGNMILTDSVRQSSIQGDYGFYNQLTDSAYVTGRACAKEYSKKDTLYLHGKVIRTYILKEDTSRVMIAHPNVRFYRSDLQGLCDSLSLMQRDSILYMHNHPIVWSGVRQIFGNVIHVHMNDSTVDWAKLPDFGFVAEHIEEEFYNQISGKEMIAYFTDSKLSHVDVSGNVQIITLPQESDSTYNKIANVESSFLSADIENNKIVFSKIWPEVTAKMTPLYLAKKSIFYLPQFKWYEAIRPKNQEDIFNIPQEMKDLFHAPEVSTRRRSSK
ncbi:MAG: LPS export ABC transporter periplasmic protein LptC [Muribaculaceae bacterium]|nr:LPS export ABC transporter periplasmic protein LptC [Muribaculaceae bacterium]